MRNRGYKQRLAAACTALMLLAAVLAGCAAAAGSDKKPGGKPQKERLTVVTTFFPLYDFARTIGGEFVETVNLIPTGVDPHDWTPKSGDMMTIANAGLFICQGAGFEGWTDEVLAGIDASRLIVVEASEGIELLPAKSGPHAGGGEHGNHHDHGGTDPHTWLSPRSALRMAENILDGLVRADPDRAAEYRANFETLKADLAALDEAYAERLAKVSKREIVVLHGAFGYLARDYGLEQVSILGVNPEGEPTAQALRDTSRFIRERGVRVIFTEQLSSAKLAETLARDLGVATVPLHPLEGLTEEEAARGETYISLMYANLERLASALQ